MYHSNKIVDTARIGIIPFNDPDKSHLLNRGELFVDYNKKKILLVDKTDKSIIHDLTAWVGENIGDIDGDFIEITIDGMGKVPIKEALSLIMNSLKTSTIKAEEISGTGYYFSNDKVNPNLFSTNRRGELEITGFSGATQDTVPVKTNGKVSWVNIKGITGGGSTGGNTGNTEGSEQNLNNSYGNTIDIKPQNSILYPQISDKQLTDTIDGRYIVILPSSENEYVSLKWLIMTGKNILELEYRNNIYFDNSYVTRMDPQSRYYLEFTSFDKGTTWNGKYTKYGTKI